MLLSVVALAGLAAQTVQKLAPGALPRLPEGLRAWLVILVSGAVGFLTNWLAIKMLFRPRVRRPWVAFWPQGLVPRERARFARALGQVASERLLNAEAIAGALEDPKLQTAIGQLARSEIERFLSEPEIRRVLVEAASEGIRDHGPAFLRRIRPELREAAERALDGYLTSERVIGWFQTGLGAFARDAVLRRAVARWLFRETAREGAVSRIMILLEEQFLRYREKHPFRGFLAEQFVIDWDDVRRGILETLRSEAAVENLADTLVDSAEGIAERLREPGFHEGVGRARRFLIERVLDWCEERGLALLSERIGELGRQAGTWEAVEGALDEVVRRLPDALFEPETGALKVEIRRRMVQMQRDLVELIPVAGIVENQVRAMDPAAIEAMVDEVGRRELAWIQILGFVLGSLMGAGLLVLLG